MSSRLIKAIQDEINYCSKKWGVSKSFVIATALADTFGVSEQESYYESSKSKTKLRRVR